MQLEFYEDFQSDKFARLKVSNRITGNNVTESNYYFMDNVKWPHKKLKLYYLHEEFINTYPPDSSSI